MARRMKGHLFAWAVMLSVPAMAAADVVDAWNGIMLTTIAGQNPFAQARFAAITQLAVFEAVNACTRRYQPYLDTVSAPSGASAEAAAVTAAHRVLKNYFPLRQRRSTRRVRNRSPPFPTGNRSTTASPLEKPRRRR
jgi:hypothetical protein